MALLRLTGARREAHRRGLLERVPTQARHHRGDVRPGLDPQPEVVVRRPHVPHVLEAGEARGVAVPVAEARHELEPAQGEQRRPSANANPSDLENRDLIAFVRVPDSSALGGEGSEVCRGCGFGHALDRRGCDLGHDLDHRRLRPRLTWMRPRPQARLLWTLPRPCLCLPWTSPRPRPPPPWTRPGPRPPWVHPRPRSRPS